MTKKLLVTRGVGAIALCAFQTLGCSSETSNRSAPGKPDAQAGTGGARGSADATVDGASGNWGNNGGDGGPRTIAAVVRDYADAWSSANEGARRALLVTSFATDGEYTDNLASNHAAGREALVSVIGSFQTTFVGAHMTPTSGVDAIEKQFRFTWKIVLADGSTLQTGEDQGEVGSDGLIQRITGFFDPDKTGSDPAAVTTLARALSDADATSRATDVQASLTTKISWIDRWMGASGVTELEKHFNDWIPPGTGGFALTGGVGQHDDRFRANLQVTGGRAAGSAQLFGHLDSGGLIDVAVYFDGDLPAP
jgi:hypothetical protein